MIRVEITNEAMAAIRKAAKYEFKQTGKQLSNGNWLVPLSKEVLSRIGESSLPEESISETILRTMASKQ